MAENVFWTNQYTNNIMLASQQLQGVVRGNVREETFVGEREFFDYYGESTAVELATRYADTPNIAQDYNRRSVTTTPLVWSTLVDRQDKVRMLADPNSSLVATGAAAIARKVDDVIIAAALGTAYGGKDGTTAYTFDPNQTVAVDYVHTGSAVNSNLTVPKIVEAQYLMDSKNVDPSIPRFIVAHPSQKKSLLNTTQVTSSDYNTVKALVNGEINTFNGFTFIWSTRVPLESGNRAAFAFAQDGLLLGLRDGLFGAITEREDKNYATQIYFRVEAGAVRMEEAKVVKILCAE
jgi:hypothetical protein